MGFNEPKADDKFLNDDDDEVSSDDDGQEEGGRNLQSYPATLDWRANGAVNAIRNQGGCGDCYAFSAVTALEGLYKVKKGTLPQLSEQ